MALYCYVKEQSAVFYPELAYRPSSNMVIATSLKANRFLPITFILAGLFLLSLVIYPLFSYKINLWRWQDEAIISPVPELALVEAKGFVTPLKVENNLEEVKVINEVDYNQITNWFPTTTVLPVQPSKVTHYTLSIPKLKVNEAVVTIGGKELKDSLIQYPGTALPGEYGNTVIFGHSVLPAFYNPKDYKAIFSLIPALEKGEKIILAYDGMQFTYQVEDYFEAMPEEIDVLEQHFDRQILSLVTCVPPGTYLRRGILRARLMKI